MYRKSEKVGGVELGIAGYSVGDNFSEPLVSLMMAAESLYNTLNFTPTEARAVARALFVAADASEEVAA